MTAYHGPRRGWNRATLSAEDVGPWQEAHPWSLFRLFGYDLWRKIRENPYGLYTRTQLGRSKKVAREMLHSVYSGEGSDHTFAELEW